MKKNYAIGKVITAFLTLASKLFCDFAHPGNAGPNTLGSPAPLPLEYLSTGGDSGGGLFRKRDEGSWELIGIGPGGGTDIEQLMKTGYYGHVMNWRRVTVFYDWIREVTGEN